MEGVISSPSSLFRFRAPSFSHPRRYANLAFSPNTKRYIVLASKNEPILDEWDQMELKFGRMLGEDPKLTLAKVIGRKLNPEMTNMEIEKSFYKNNGKILDIEELPFDGSIRGQSSKLPSGLNLVRPVPKKGVKFEVDKPKLSQVKRPQQPFAKPVANSRSSVPDVILRKPSIYDEYDVGTENSSRLRMKPNLTLKMGKQETKERFSDFTLVRRPEPMNANVHNKKEPSDVAKGKVTEDMEESCSESVSLSTGTTNDVTLLGKPEMVNFSGSESVSESTTTDDVELLESPEMVNFELNNDQGQEALTDFSGSSSSNVALLGKPEMVNFAGSESVSVSTTTNDVELLERPKIVNLELNNGRGQEALKDYTGSSSSNDVTENILKIGNSTTELVNGENLSLDQSMGTLDRPSIRDHEHEDNDVTGPGEKFSSTETKVVDPNTRVPTDAALIKKPKRLDQNYVKGTLTANGEEMVLVNLESYDNIDELENCPETSPIKERENIDWKKAEDLFQMGGREEVEMISSSTRGFVVSFGSLIGFLPYRNLATKYKYLAFESWLRRKGLDPSVYKQNLGIIGNYEATSKAASLDSSLDPPMDRKVDGEISPDMKLEDLLMIYDQEKLKFLSSFVGQKIKVNVVLADRISRRLIFSVKPKEKEESIERKKKLMAKLSVGDVVKCCIKKITYFGIFVEVEGVPALIHQTEVSWDSTLDPASYFKIGQIMEAKVYQLDFSLERIFLSLKEITPDPLTETLEAVVGDSDSLNGRLEVAQANTEWADVESLVKELEQYEGIQSVSKGRFFLSPGLAPTFQVYMASMFENQYKLLARSENKVQEVIVQTSLGKEEMKSAILTCTNRVA